MWGEVGKDLYFESLPFEDEPVCISIVGSQKPKRNENGEGLEQSRDL